MDGSWSRADAMVSAMLRQAVHHRGWYEKKYLIIMLLQLLDWNLWRLVTLQAITCIHRDA